MSRMAAALTLNEIAMSNESLVRTPFHSAAQFTVASPNVLLG